MEKYVIKAKIEVPSIHVTIAKFDFEPSASLVERIVQEYAEAHIVVISQYAVLK